MAIKTTTTQKKAKPQSKEEPDFSARPTATEDLNQLISQRAYERFLHRGAEFGSDLEDWLLAEQEILGTVCTPVPAPQVKKVVAKAKRAAPPPPAPYTAKRPATTTRTRRKSAPEAPQS
jgi:hypothetical protein